MIHLRSPESEKEWEEYYLLRYEVLRKPHNQPKGSEKDDKENETIHCAAFLEGKIVGVGRVQWNTESIAQVRYMAVEEKYRNKEIGSKILKYLEEQAKKKRMKIITLNARIRAVPFYKRNGYVVEKPIDPLYGVPHFEMRKILK